MGVRKNVNLHARSSIWKDRRVDAADDLPVVMPSPSRLSAWLWGVLALLVGLAFTLAAHRQQQQGQLAAQSTVRTELADKTFAALKARLAAADAMLRAVQTLFLASDEVTQTEFANFYTNLRPRERIGERIGRYADAGVTTLGISPFALSIGERLDTLRIMSELVPSTTQEASAP